MAAFKIRCPKCGEEILIASVPNKEIRAKCKVCGHAGRLNPRKKTRTRRDSQGGSEIQETEKDRPHATSASRKSRIQSPDKSPRRSLTFAIAALFLIPAVGLAWQFAAGFVERAFSPETSTAGQENAETSAKVGITEKGSDDSTKNETSATTAPAKRTTQTDTEDSSAKEDVSKIAVTAAKGNTLAPGHKVWTNHQGQELFVAKLKTFDGSTAVFEGASGVTYSVSVSKLSDEAVKSVLEFNVKPSDALLPTDKNAIGTIRVASRSPELPGGTGDEVPTPPEETQGLEASERHSLPEPKSPQVVTWRDSKGADIIEADLVTIENGMAVLQPAARVWQLNPGTPQLKTLHVITMPNPYALGKKGPLVKLRDPISRSLDPDRSLEKFSLADQQYVRSIESALRAGTLLDLTDPKRARLKSYGIRWGIPLDQLCEAHQKLVQTRIEGSESLRP